MSLAREASRAVRATLVLWVITAIIYPFVMIAFGQIVFPFQANGSLLKNTQGQVVGSALIGQPFVSDRYFNSRPSTTHYSTGKNELIYGNAIKTGAVLDLTKITFSGASNLAPSNPALLNRIKGKSDSDPKKAIEEDMPRFQKAGVKPTADLVYTSGSGLDPHITPDAAKAQIQRVAKARGLDPNRVESLITQHTDGRFLGIFGESGVNVLKLNLALDDIKAKP
jgi:potassium-transporting ATPase KdpC subunit